MGNREDGRIGVSVLADDNITKISRQRQGVKIKRADRHVEAWKHRIRLVLHIPSKRLVGHGRDNHYDQHQQAQNDARDHPSATTLRHLLILSSDDWIQSAREPVRQRRERLWWCSTPIP